MIDLNSIKLDIEKRSALLLLPVFTAKPTCEEDAKTLMEIGNIQKMVVSREGMDICVYIWYDFGDIIPEVCWTMFGKDSMVGIIGKRESEQMTAQAVLEGVKAVYPKVALEIQRWAKGFVGVKDDK